MIFAPIRVEYSLAREREGGAPFFIDIEGTPETLQEMQQYGGKTRQTCTIAEAEAKGVTLATAFAAIDADMARRLADAEASIIQINATANELVAAAVRAKAEAEINAIGMEARALAAEQLVATLQAQLAELGAQAERA